MEVKGITLFMSVHFYASNEMEAYKSNLGLLTHPLTH